MAVSETDTERLARLEEELQEPRKTFPEHCYGTKGYIGVHRATPAHYQRLEKPEEEIKRLKAGP